MFKIGDISISSGALLAPMAGVTDLPFRDICLSLGASLATTEMVTSNTKLWSSDKSAKRLAFSSTQQDHVLSVQIAGTEPKSMAEAALACEQRGAQIIDINMGCPAKKVCKKLAGSALMKDPRLVENILKTIVGAVSIPVTLKTRTGWDLENKNVLTIGKIAEDQGIKALTVHGRTRACRFNGRAEYDSIAHVVDQLSIPVIANGDITSVEQAVEVMKYTEASAVMIGRAALGNPWIFSDIQTQLGDEKDRGDGPTLKDKQQIIILHLEGLHRLYGELKGTRIARKHLAWYCSKLPESKGFITTINKIEEPEKQLDTVRNYFDQLNTYEDKAA